MADNDKNSLDEMIAANKTESRWRGRRGREGGRGGPIRRPWRQQRQRPGPYSRRRQGVFSRLDFSEHHGSRALVLETGTKLFVSNLHYNLDDGDIEDLFSELGQIDLKRSAIHYDSNGRSMGTAEVVFARREDGLRAMEKYNNQILDGSPLNIELVHKQASAATPPVSTSSRGRGRGYRKH